MAEGINYDKAAAHIRHTLGGELSPDLDMVDVMNNAGDFMTALYPWQWLEEVTGSMTLNADGYASTSLPADFVELLSYHPRGTDSRLTSGEVAYLVSPEELLDIRAGSESGAGITLGALKNYFALVYDGTTPKLDCVTGGTTITTVKLRYRKGWTSVAADGTRFRLPTWMEGLYYACVRTFARGYEEEDIATLSKRLDDLRYGPLLAACIERDSNVLNFTRHRVNMQPDWSVPGLHEAGEARA